MCGGGNLQIHLELGVTSARSMKLHGCIVSTNVEGDVRLFDMALTPRLDGVLQPNLHRIAVPDAEIASARSHVHASAAHELTAVGMSLFVLPVACCAEWNKQQTKQDNLPRLAELER